MNIDNLMLLKHNLRFLGFGEMLSSTGQLEAAMLKGEPEFQLNVTENYNEISSLKATLYFRKSPGSDTYTFVKYDAHLIYDVATRVDRTQTFHVKGDAGITLRESFNLLEGRSVYKTFGDADETKYCAWIQLSFGERTHDNSNYRFRKFGPEYRYDLERVINAYPIRELKEDALKMNLLISLKKGNLHLVTFEKSGKSEKKVIAACPQFKTISIYTEALIHATHTPKSKH